MIYNYISIIALKEKPEMEENSTINSASMLAAALIQARQTGQVVSAETVSGTALDSGDAYRIQAEVARAVGAIGGFKVANKPDAPRIMAPIFAHDIQQSPAAITVPATENIGIELEIGFRVDAPLPGHDEPDRRRLIAERLSAVAVIEIVRTRLPADVSPLLKLADNQINGGLMLGQPVKDWQSLSMGRVDAFLRLGDKVCLNGEATVPGGDAFENFLALEEIVGSHCGGLQPGHVVITGSLNGLPYVSAQTAIHGRIDGLGEVSLRLDTLG